MPHPSSNTTTFTNATNQMISPQQDYVREKRFLVPTPPPCSSSPVELPPILDICDAAVLDNRPPSPDSPKIKKFCIELKQEPPAFLEPKPQMELSHQTGFFSLDLFKVFKKTNISSQILIPRRSQKVSRPITNDTPMSPIMAAASASAAAAAAHQHPGSHVAKSLLKSISGKRASLHEDTDYQEDVTFTAPQQTRPLNKKQATAAVDQSMFLTKNAHIKRPRNAWIHFRCHYGQALKSQDPTLRAEEISKRASRRWGKLSENEKKPWHGLAEQEKLAHREAFPEYRYCPRRANSTSSPPSPPPPTSLNMNRPRSASEVNTPLLMHDYNSNNARLQKKMKRISK